ncbi:MAG: ketoacyl-ACP synthase III [Desulfobulbus sp.]|nr:ketoacyl-ACP synthase III [Desulfobulbus sp.]
MPNVMNNAAIVGLGVYVPENILTNDDLSKFVDVSDEWIRAKSGIRERHIAGSEQATSDLGSIAAQRALHHAGISPDEVDLVIVATATPDMQTPSTACLIQANLQMNKAAAFDLVAGCTGFIYALTVGSQFITSGFYRTVLVIGAEVLSSILDWSNRETCILFGDGAGAVVLRATSPGKGILASCLCADGTGANHLRIPAGGARTPLTAQGLAGKQNKLQMNGPEVFKFAMRRLPEVTEKALAMAQIRREDIALIIPHQANLRIIEAAARYMDIPLERFMINLERYGNTSAASIPIALQEALEIGRVKKGDIIVLSAFGAGLACGASVIRWEI